MDRKGLQKKSKEGQLKSKTMIILIITLLVLSFKIKQSNGATFYEIKEKEIVADKNFVKKVLLKSYLQECLSECVHTINCRSFNINTITTACYLFNVTNGAFKDNRYNIYFFKG